MQHIDIVNISYFYDQLESTGNRHLWIYISCPCRRAPLPPNANVGLSDWSYCSSG